MPLIKISVFFAVQLRRNTSIEKCHNSIETVLVYVRAVVFFNALEQASLVDENDPFVDMLEPDIFKEEHSETRCVLRLASNS